MYVVDFLPVGDRARSGDAIAMMFTESGTGENRVVLIDAGFQDDGVALVEHVTSMYGTRSVDLAILTHPDGDHIGGMGEVIRGLEVQTLWVHDIGDHGGASLDAADAVNDLIAVAQDRGTDVRQPWAGASAFGGALTVLGPSMVYYEQLVREQLKEAPIVAKSSRLLEAARGLAGRFSALAPPALPFSEKDVTPRNNSSIITRLEADNVVLLFTGDAGIPALSRAWDFAESREIAQKPSMVQVPHHGSRRNASSGWLDRLLGPVGQGPSGAAFVSVVADSDKHPSGRVVNAYRHRGYPVTATAGRIRASGAWQHRPGWSTAETLPFMSESSED